MFDLPDDMLYSEYIITINNMYTFIDKYKILLYFFVNFFSTVRYLTLFYDVFLII